MLDTTIIWLLRFSFPVMRLFTAVYSCISSLQKSFMVTPTVTFPFRFFMWFTGSVFFYFVDLITA